ncbi:MAG: hypothetical protein C4317_09235 [Acidimicrobiia bacterium]
MEPHLPPASRACAVWQARTPLSSSLQAYVNPKQDDCSLRGKFCAEHGQSVGTWYVRQIARARCVEPVVRSPDDAAPHFVALLADSPQERVAVLSLDAAHGPISARVVFSGGLDRSIIDPKILFSGLLRERACAFILAHNHPSGSLDPSRHDIAVTDRLRTCAEFLDIAFLDHLVIGGDRWTSMRERGYLGASDSKDWGYLAS